MRLSSSFKWEPLINLCGLSLLKQFTISIHPALGRQRWQSRAPPAPSHPPGHPGSDVSSHLWHQPPPPSLPFSLPPFHPSIYHLSKHKFKQPCQSPTSYSSIPFKYSKPLSHHLWTPLSVPSILAPPGSSLHNHYYPSKHKYKSHCLPAELWMVLCCLLKKTRFLHWLSRSGPLSFQTNGRTCIVQTALTFPFLYACVLPLRSSTSRHGCRTSTFHSNHLTTFKFFIINKNYFVIILLVLSFGGFWPGGIWDLKLPNQGSNPWPLHWKVKS